MLASLKPVLSALILPPGGLLVLLMAVLGLLRWHPRRACVATLAAGLLGVLLWLTSTQGFALWLQDALLPQARPSVPWLAQAAPTGVQAVVVLGGGVREQATEWPQQQSLSPHALERLVYGAALARAWSLPLGFSGGRGWGAGEQQTLSEAQVAQNTLQLWGQSLRWAEARSRDTAENAKHSAALLLPQGVRHIALVTHAWHMPRAQADFQRFGFTVTPVPVAAITASQPWTLRWLPSVQGMEANHWLTHEALGLLARQLGVLPRAAD